MIPILFMAIAGLLGPYSASCNFSADLTGKADTRESTWGTADSYNFTVVLSAPTGYRVRILRLSGDLVAWPKTMPADAAVVANQYAGVLLGFQTTAPPGSLRCNPCADNTMLYIQSAMRADPVRAPFDNNVRVGGLLERDGKLIVVVAAWLNTTQRPIHIEPTFTVEYCYEPEL